MKQKNQILRQNDSTAQIAAENLNLSPKQAAKFARQAAALRHNLALRRRQQLQKENHHQNQEDLPNCTTYPPLES